MRIVEGYGGGGSSFLVYPCFLFPCQEIPRLVFYVQISRSAMLTLLHGIYYVCIYYSEHGRYCSM